VNFADILEKWEKQNPENGVYEKNASAIRDAEKLDGDVSRKNDVMIKRRSRLLRKKPDAVIDLHGFNCEEAWIAMQTFFNDGYQQGLEKLLVIHGKGSHCSDTVKNFQLKEGALRELVRRFIEGCPFAGESGYSSSREGGRGATWVILKEDALVSQSDLRVPSVPGK